jgi:PPOX class probable F420-dependent enzyme
MSSTEHDGVRDDNADPTPRPLLDDELSHLLTGQRFGVLAATGLRGHPHLSTVLYSWDPTDHLLRISTTADRAKVRHLRRDPRAALHVSGPNVWSFAVAEGTADLSPVTTTPGDAVGRELLSMTPGFDDPAAESAFLAGLVAERRLVIRISVDRLYGTALDLPE